MILKARYVVPVDAPVIESGAVEINGDRIVAVGPARGLSGRSVIDYGDAVICPAFVNAHTHLELSHLAGKIPPSPDLIDWLGRLVQASRKTSMTAARVRRSMQAGIEQSLQAGVTVLGDITRLPGWTRGPLGTSGLYAVSFGEIIAVGTRRDLLTERLDAAASIEYQTERMRVGISPHAPYSVEPAGMVACAARAAQMGAPLCIHLAESPDEAAFTRNGSGPFAEFGRRLGLWDRRVPASGCGPVELAHRAGVLTERTLIAHGNYVAATDITLIAKSGAGVAYCPRTHAAFGHDPHPFRELLQAGVNVCIGTDSLASNPSLSVLDELRFVRKRYPDFSPDELLAMGTLRGARALGLDGQVGSITPGKSADLVIVRPEPAEASRWEAILESSCQPVEVVQAGQPVRRE
jgi:cytosine/adenosine deaminase-related metal-dependent hydrolase